jgi:hypothetical protein
MKCRGCVDKRVAISRQVKMDTPVASEFTHVIWLNLKLADYQYVPVFNRAHSPAVFTTHIHTSKLGIYSLVEG